MSGSAPKSPPRRPARRPGPTSGRARRTPVARRNERPWGWIATLTVTVVAAAALIAYVATRPSTSNIAGVRSYPSLARNHVTGTVHYPQNPPAGGNHAAVPLTCGAYDRPVPNENAVHSLEHGAVWITYRPGLPASQLAALRGLLKGSDQRLLSPYTGLPAPIVATARGKQIFVNTANDPRLSTFVTVYTEGSTDPEPGAACQGVGAPSG